MKAAAGQLCLAPLGTDLSAGECTLVSGERFPVRPAAIARSWMWVDPDGRSIVLGSLAAGASEIELGQRPATMLLQVVGSEHRDWPVPTRLSIGTPLSVRSWKVTLSPQRIVSLRAFTVPAGEYDVALEASRHWPWKNRFRSRLLPLDAGRIELMPLPIVRARFVDERGQALSNVIVETVDGDPVAVSDASGTVSADSPLLRIVARKEGLATREFWLAESMKTCSDREEICDLGTVTMVPGATLTVDIARNSYTGPVTVSVLHPETGMAVVGKPRKVAAQTIREGSRIELRDLSAGEYVLQVHGNGPLEVMLDPLRIGARERVRRTVAIEPKLVKVKVRQGKTAIPRAELELVTGDRSEWLSRATTDSEGRLELQAWQNRAFEIEYEKDGETEYATSARVDAPEVDWDIVVPGCAIRGVVVDEVTGKPLGDVTTHVRWTDGDQFSWTSPRTRADGTFAVVRAKPGRYVFSIEGSVFREVSTTVEIGDDCPERVIELKTRRLTK